VTKLSALHCNADSSQTTQQAIHTLCTFKYVVHIHNTRYCALTSTCTEDCPHNQRGIVTKRQQSSRQCTISDNCWTSNYFLSTSKISYTYNILTTIQLCICTTWSLFNQPLQHFICCDSCSTTQLCLNANHKLPFRLV